MWSTLSIAISIRMTRSMMWMHLKESPIFSTLKLITQVNLCPYWSLWYLVQSEQGVRSVCVHVSQLLGHQQYVRVIFNRGSVCWMSLMQRDMLITADCSRFIRFSVLCEQANMFNLQYVTTEDVIGVKSTVSVAVLRDIVPIPMHFLSCDTHR